MVNSLKRTEPVSVRHIADQSASWATFARNKFNAFIATAHHTLLICGVAAITLLGVMFFKPDVADQLISLSPFADTVAEEMTAEPASLASALNAPVRPSGNSSAASTVAEIQANAALHNAGLNGANHESSAKHYALTTDTNVLPVTDGQQKRVSYWLSKRYRLAGDAANMLVSHTYQTAKEIKLDPLLILAVMAIESGFNPYAESPVGAQGLMQVMSKIHHEKFQYLGGLKAALNPLANIKVGSLILKDYVSRGGSVEAGLKTYVGAAAFDNDAGYGSKVMAEYRRLKDVATGKNVPTFSTTASAINNPAPKQRHIEPALPKTDIPNEAAISPHGQLPLHQGEQVAAL